MTGQGFLGNGVSSAAVEAFSRLLAGELGARGVRVVCLRPHAIPEAVPHSHTREVFSVMADGAGTDIETMLARHAESGTLLRRLPTLAQVAQAAVFAASDHAGAMTGSVVNLTCGALERWRRRHEFRDEAMRYLERMRLAEHAAKYPHQLPGGMQQRVAIAQALMLKPQVLMMDEPFGALDPDTREDMQLFLLELWEQQRMTVFFVTHDLDEVPSIVSHGLLLRDGRSVLEGSAEEVLGAYTAWMMRTKLRGPAPTSA